MIETILNPICLQENVLIQIINKHELSDVWRFFHEDKSNILGHIHVIMSYLWQDWIDLCV